MSAIQGSKKVQQFISDAMEGRHSVDIVHLGDSNTGHQEGGQLANGWLDALTSAILTLAPNSLYASPMYQMGALGTPNYGVGMNMSNSGTLLADTPTPFPPANQDYSGAGNDSFPVYPILQSLVSPLKVSNTNSGSCIWRTTSTATRHADFGAGIYINQTGSGMDVNNTFIYRVVHGLFNDATAEMRVLIKLNGGAPLDAMQAISFHSTTAAGTIKHSSITFPPFARNGNIHIGTCGAGVGDANGFKPPFAVGWNSVTVPRKGFASSILSHHGSATLTGVLNNVTTSTRNYLETYFREIILRQTQASTENFARCIIWLNGGQNGGDADAANYWANVAAPACAALKAAWIAAGGEAQHLCFVAMTSHQIVDPDTDRDAVRASADTFANNATDLNVTSINLAKLVTWAEISAGANVLFASSNPTTGHLADAGYNLYSTRVIMALRNKHLNG